MLSTCRKYIDSKSVSNRNTFPHFIRTTCAKAAFLTIPSDSRVYSAFLSLLRYVHLSVCNTIFGIQFSRRATRNWSATDAYGKESLAKITLSRFQQSQFLSVLRRDWRRRCNRYPFGRPFMSKMWFEAKIRLQTANRRFERSWLNVTVVSVTITDRQKYYLGCEIQIAQVSWTQIYRIVLSLMTRNSKYSRSLDTETDAIFFILAFKIYLIKQTRLIGQSV